MSSDEDLQSLADSVTGAILEAICTATQAGIAGQSCLIGMLLLVRK